MLSFGSSAGPKKWLYGESSTSSDDSYSSISGGDLSESENSDFEETKTRMAMPEQKRVHDQKCANTQPEWAERTGHAKELAAFQELPGELILEFMHHMDKKTLENLVQSSDRVSRVWNKYSIAVLIGIQNTQFAELTSMFGHPSARNTEQQQTLEEVRGLLSQQEVPQISESVSVGHGLPDKISVINLWWSHFVFLESCRKKVDSEIRSLNERPGGPYGHRNFFERFPVNEEFGMDLPESAVRLLFQMSACSQLGQPRNLSQISRAGRQVQIFLAQPMRVQECFLQMVQYLIPHLDEEFTLSIAAVEWAEAKVSQGNLYFGRLNLQDVGATDVYLARRVMAKALDIIFHHGIQGSMLLMEEESSHLSASDAAVKIDVQMRQMLDMAVDETTVLAEAMLFDGIGLVEEAAMLGVRRWRNRQTNRN